MNASDITRLKLGSATLNGFQMKIMKTSHATPVYGTSTGFDLSGCCGFFDPSACNFNSNVIIQYPDYQFANNVKNGLYANDCIQESIVNMTNYPVVLNISTNTIYPPVYVKPGVSLVIPLQ